MALSSVREKLRGVERETSINYKAVAKVTARRADMIAHTPCPQRRRNLAVTSALGHPYTMAQKQYLLIFPALLDTAAGQRLSPQGNRYVTGSQTSRQTEA